MDFIRACKEAEAGGISRQEFLKVWELEAKMKQTEQELNLQKMRTDALNSQVRDVCEVLYLLILTSRELNEI